MSLLKKKVKHLSLKLGGACNLHCKHCHSTAQSYKFNEDIIPYIKKQHFSQITFCGGEPLLYIDTIKMIVDKLPKGMRYRIVSNGTLLTDELADYFNKHNFAVGFSYDGDNHSRDLTYLQCWHSFKKINEQRMPILFSEDNRDTAKLLDDIQKLSKKYELKIGGSTVWVNFIHQTKNHDESIDISLVKDYCLFLAGQLELEMRKFKADPTIKDLPVMMMSFAQWIKKYKGRGVHCFNENLTMMSVDGKFLLCPYDGSITVGDIYTGIDWDKIESFIPDRCKGCPQWESCGNTCIANTTTNECFISKVMYHHFYKLMKKYNITYEEIDEAFSNSGLSGMNADRFGWFKDIGQKIKSVLTRNKK